MDLGSLFLILAVLVLVGLFISRPFFTRPAASGMRSSPQSREKEHQYSTLLAERDQVLTALQELDFDHALGKIPEEEYPAQRAGLLQNGADILRRLDAFQEQTPAQAAEARMEAAIAARRADTGRAAGGGSLQTAALAAEGDELEKVIAARRQTRQEKAAGFCPRCGKPVQKSDHFCPKCGATL